MLYQLILSSLLFISLVGDVSFTIEPHKESDEPKALEIKRTSDFEITGDGSAKNWDHAEWVTITQRNSTKNPLTTKTKILYSDTGIYFLFHCQDKILTATMDADFLDLWKEDVVEVFLWTDEDSPVYFEYEISPLNYELPILISNEEFDLVRWQPFHYDSDRKTRHATSIQGGDKKSNSAITSWTAEFFIPYKLLRPLNNVPPTSGTRWRANMYRVDYDENNKSSWSWELTTKTFHNYEKFGVLLFE